MVIQVEGNREKTKRTKKKSNQNMVLNLLRYPKDVTKNKFVLVTVCINCKSGGATEALPAF